LSNFKVLPNLGFWGLNIQIDNFVLIIIQNSNYNLQDKLQNITQCIDFKRENGKIVKLSHKSSISFPCWFFNSQTRGRFSLLSPFPPFPSLPLLSFFFPSPQNSQTKPKPYSGDFPSTLQIVQRKCSFTMLQCLITY